MVTTGSRSIIRHDGSNARCLPASRSNYHARAFIFLCLRKYCIISRGCSPLVVPCKRFYLGIDTDDAGAFRASLRPYRPKARS